MMARRSVSDKTAISTPGSCSGETIPRSLETAFEVRAQKTRLALARTQPTSAAVWLAHHLSGFCSA
jgi:hypothetical protein